MAEWMNNFCEYLTAVSICRSTFSSDIGLKDWHGAVVFNSSAFSTSGSSKSLNVLKNSLMYPSGPGLLLFLSYIITCLICTFRLYGWGWVWVTCSLPFGSCRLWSTATLLVFLKYLICHSGWCHLSKPIFGVLSWPLRTPGQVLFFLEWLF